MPARGGRTVRAAGSRRPGRIDLGIGRAPGSDPVTSLALRGPAGRDDRDIENFPDYLDDVVALMSARGARVPIRNHDYILKATRLRSANRGCGCWGRRCIPHTWPPPRGCRTCSPTTSPAREPKKHSPSTARNSSPAS
ncbi:putative alkanal monooxygenase [Mycobacterium xenopi 3993]|nr:putative alkanal monooxygenase [Mycobacterium xenopi 3993]